MTASVVLLRHGQASFGAVDYDILSGVGRRQAVRLGEALKSRIARVDSLLSGTLRRQRDTASICLEAMGLAAPLEADPAWNEFDHEDVIRAYDPRFLDHALFHPDLSARAAPAESFDRVFLAAVARWTAGGHDADYRESWPAFLARVDAALARLVRGSGGTVLVFTSGGPISAACRGLLRATNPAGVLGHAFQIANASVTELAADGEGLVLRSFNDHGHFSGAHAGLLTLR